ncbi:MAG: prephenate dehydrogenase/arogenate dehydrogenase family protein [Clostridiales bacterium]|nr:MAG: prephenate dehydrogenase/arogenate dehydrogenase family protein [Clostridiales bacterium]
MRKDCRFKKHCGYDGEKNTTKLLPLPHSLRTWCQTRILKARPPFLQCGFSAGSFLDMTRVAYLNENMWTELFMMNKESLCTEIQTIINHLEEYKTAMENGDKEKLKSLLKDGRELKEKRPQKDKNYLVCVLLFIT